MCYCSQRRDRTGRAVWSAERLCTSSTDHLTQQIGFFKDISHCRCGAIYTYGSMIMLTSVQFDKSWVSLSGSLTQLSIRIFHPTVIEPPSVRGSTSWSVISIPIYRPVNNSGGALSSAFVRKLHPKAAPTAATTTTTSRHHKYHGAEDQDLYTNDVIYRLPVLCIQQLQ